jgi:hypothetical protein
MAARWQWSDLSPRSRRLIIAAATAEAGLKTAALIDIKRRPASQIRGPKWLWAVVVVLVNSLGGTDLVLPLRAATLTAPGSCREDH